MRLSNSFLVDENSAICSFQESTRVCDPEGLELLRGRAQPVGTEQGLLVKVFQLVGHSLDQEREKKEQGKDKNKIKAEHSRVNEINLECVKCLPLLGISEQHLICVICHILCKKLNRNFAKGRLHCRKDQYFSKFRSDA